MPFILNELEPVYVYPEYDEKTGLNGEVKADEIALLLEKKSKYQGSYDCITDI